MYVRVLLCVGTSSVGARVSEGILVRVRVCSHGCFCASLSTRGCMYTAYARVGAFVHRVRAHRCSFACT
jgi:hypothetical protein